MKSSLDSPRRASPRRILAGLLLGLAVITGAYAQSYTQNFATAVTPAPTGWTIGGGTWAVSGGTFNHTSANFREIAFYNTTTWTDNYSYKARVMRTSGTNYGNIAGVVFNYQSATAHYDVTMSTSGGVHTVSLNTVGAGSAVTELASTTFANGGVNQWVDVEIIRGNGTTSVKINGVQVFTNIAQATLSGGGKVGVFASWASSKYDDVSVGTPEAEVQGNSVVIADGDATPSASDFTDFGATGVSGGTVTRTFTLRNTGTGTLGVGTVSTTGDFAVTAQPATLVDAAGSTTFSVRFDPSALGVRTGTVSVATTDADENPYNFSISGTGTDNIAPTVAVSAPLDGATVSGSSVTITATASDNVGVAGVQFKLDGSNLGSEVLSAPYSISWNTVPAANGSHVLTAVARDAAGNTTPSAGIFANVNNGGGSLPAGWSAQDVGSVGAPGTSSQSSGTYTIAGAGVGIWNTADEFRFAYQQVTGDCTIIARVVSVENTGAAAGWEHGGVMIRESLAANSRYIGAYQTATRGLLCEARTSTGGTAVGLGDSNHTGTYWVKLTRSGSNFIAYASSDGVAWAVLGSQTIAMGSTVYVGLAVTSQVDATTCTTVFDNVSVSLAATYAPAFPRVAVDAIGGNQGFPTTVWSTLAKFHIVILGGNWEGWDTNRGFTRQDLVTGIKSASTVDTKVFQYVIFETVGDDANPGNVWNPTWKATATANNWWLYNSGTSGTKSVWRPGFWTINETTFAPVDPLTGLRPFQSGAQYAYDMFINMSSSMPAGNKAPALDGFFLDNMLWKPRANGDWNRNGASGDATDSQNDPTAQLWYRTGHKDFIDKIRTLMPGKWQIGNNADLPAASTTDQNAIAPLSGLINGGINESILGHSNSPELWGGFATAMAWYRYCMDSVAAPKLQLFQHVGLTVDGIDPNDPTATPFRSMRYGLAFCLMNDGYYTGELSHSANLADIRWFDEYTGGSIGMGYLGQPVSGPLGEVQTNYRWNKGTLGVWAREFTNGIAILNPKGNGQQTLTPTDLGGSTVWKRILRTSSSQWAGNDGSNVTGNLTLEDRDGIILLRR